MRVFKYIRRPEEALSEFVYVCKKAKTVIEFANSQSYQRVLRHWGSQYGYLSLLTLDEASKLMKKTGFEIVGVKKGIRLPFFMYGKVNDKLLLNVLIKVEQILDAMIPRMLFVRDFVIIADCPKSSFTFKSVCR